MRARSSTTVGIVLCALVVSAFAVANASAESKSFKCVAGGGSKDFNDEHCLTKVAEGTGKWGHEAIVGTIATKATNAKTASGTEAARVKLLHGTISGVETEIQCTGLTGTGELTNAAASVSSTGTVQYTGCTVLKPAGRECVVTGGSITTKKLAATTVGQAANKVKVTPFEGTQFATVSISNCKENIPPTANYPVTGSLVADTSGATTTTTREGSTAQNTLKFGGNKAGIDGAATGTDTAGIPIVGT